mgnify:CR=1 FL=1
MSAYRVQCTLPTILCGPSPKFKQQYFRCATNGSFYFFQLAGMGRSPTANHENSVTAYGLEWPTGRATARAERDRPDQIDSSRSGSSGHWQPPAAMTAWHITLQRESASTRWWACLRWTECLAAERGQQPHQTNDSGVGLRCPIGGQPSGQGFRPLGGNIQVLAGDGECVVSTPFHHRGCAALAAASPRHGAVAPGCPPKLEAGNSEAMALKLMSWSGCGGRASVTAATIFDRSRTPLTVWFNACWLFATSKDRRSALSLKRTLGIGSRQTAWAMLHRLRSVLVRPGRDRLTGLVKVDETYIGGQEAGLLLIGLVYADAYELVHLIHPDAFSGEVGNAPIAHLIVYATEQLATGTVPSTPPKAFGHPQSLDRPTANHPWRYSG